MTKATLYEQVARVGKALSSPKRLEFIELLAQGEKTVEKLAEQADIDVRLASAHLRTLREARLVESRREGKFKHYHLTSHDVVGLWVNVRQVAEAHLAELRFALAEMTSAPDLLSEESYQSLLTKARDGDIIVIDVRPDEEFSHAHLPFARSMPLDELEQRLAELPPGTPVVAYCRGPFCLMSDKAVTILRRRGFDAHKIADGVGEWRTYGLPLEN